MRSRSPNSVRAQTYLIWAVLAVPALALALHDILSFERTRYLRYTGLVSCWLIILAMSITPLQLLLGRQDWLTWLRIRRRHFGVAGFLYALLHLLVFIVLTNPKIWLLSFSRFDFAVGWAGFAILAVVAATSNDWSVRRLGRNWKKVQQLVYLGGFLTLLHWITSENRYLEVAIYTTPLIVLSIWRIRRNWQRSGAVK